MPDDFPRTVDREDRSRLGLLVALRVMLFLLVAAVTLLASFQVADTGGLGLEVSWAVDWWFAVLASVGITGAIIAIDLLTPKKKLSTLSGMLVGLIGGLIAAIAVSFVIDLIVESYPLSASENERIAQIVTAIKVLVGVALCYLGVAIVLQTQDDFRLVIPYVEFAKQIRGTKPLLQDSSALIDGRIHAVAETGLLQAPIVIPRFVLAELQRLADSGEKTKRARGRRGLEIVTKLQRSPILDVTIDETIVPGKNVDQMLVELAQRMPATLVTNDIGLARIASIHDVSVINMNEVAGSMKPDVIPGEPLLLRILKRGEQPGQGVGYLDDGTMVVIEDGAGQVGEEVTITVRSSLQTAAGRMIFGRIGDVDEAEPAGHAEAQRNEWSMEAEDMEREETISAEESDESDPAPLKGEQASAEQGGGGPFGPKRSAARGSGRRNPRRG